MAKGPLFFKYKKAACFSIPVSAAFVSAELISHIIFKIQGEACLSWKGTFYRIEPRDLSPKGKPSPCVLTLSELSVPDHTCSIAPQPLHGISTLSFIWFSVVCELWPQSWNVPLGNRPVHTCHWLKPRELCAGTRVSPDQGLYYDNCLMLSATPKVAICVLSTPTDSTKHCSNQLMKPHTDVRRMST